MRHRMWKIGSCLLIALVFSGAAMASPPEGGQSPDFTLPVLDGHGRTVTLWDFRGRIVLLNFWASWCASCKDEMPGLAALEEEFGPQGFSLLAVSVDKHESRAVSFMDKLRRSLGRTTTFLALHDEDGGAVRAYNPRGMPTSYLIDCSGRIVKEYIGSFDDRGFIALRARIREELKK